MKIYTVRFIVKFKFNVLVLRYLSFIYYKLWLKEDNRNKNFNNIFVVKNLRLSIVDLCREIIIIINNHIKHEAIKINVFSCVDCLTFGLYKYIINKLYIIFA